MLFRRDNNMIQHKLNILKTKYQTYKTFTFVVGLTTPSYSQGKVVVFWGGLMEKDNPIRSNLT
jgi:hypothetical protein